MQRLRGNPVPLVKRDLCPLPSPQTTKDSWVIVLPPPQGSPVTLCAQREPDKQNISYPVCKALKVSSVTVRRWNSSSRSTEDRARPLIENLIHSDRGFKSFNVGIHLNMFKKKASHIVADK